MNASYYCCSFASPENYQQRFTPRKEKKRKEINVAEAYICITRICKLKKGGVQMNDSLLKMPGSTLNSRLDPARHNSRSRNAGPAWGNEEGGGTAACLLFTYNIFLQDDEALAAFHQARLVSLLLLPSKGWHFIFATIWAINTSLGFP